MVVPHSPLIVFKRFSGAVILPLFAAPFKEVDTSIFGFSYPDLKWPSLRYRFTSIRLACVIGFWFSFPKFK
jgi:hypothetical protein